MFVDLKRSLAVIIETGRQSLVTKGIEGQKMNLTSESVQGTSLPLESVDNIHGSDSLPLGVLGVSDSVTNDVLEEHLEDTAGFLVDETRDTLYTTTTSQSTDSGLGNTLDIITQDLPVTLCATLSEPLATLTATSHFCDLT